MRLLLLIALCFGTKLYAAQSLDELRAGYLHQITYFIDFPQKKASALHICFNDITTGPGAILASKGELWVNKRRIELIDLSKSLKNKELSYQCDITYFEGTIENDILSPWLKIQPLNTLIIGDNFEFLAAGGVAALIQEGEKIRLYVYREHLAHVNFKIQARLLSVSKFYPN
ncbi:YfiR family protein [Pseudoalteromonas sp. GB56]